MCTTESTDQQPASRKDRLFLSCSLSHFFVERPSHQEKTSAILEKAWRLRSVFCARCFRCCSLWFKYRIHPSFWTRNSLMTCNATFTHLPYVAFFILLSCVFVSQDGWRLVKARNECPSGRFQVKEKKRGEQRRLWTSMNGKARQCTDIDTFFLK